MIKANLDEISNRLLSYQLGRNRIEWEHISKGRPLDFTDIDSSERSFINLGLIESLGKASDDRNTNLLRLKLMLKIIDLDPGVCRLNEVLNSIVEDNRNLIEAINSATGKEEIDIARESNLELSRLGKSSLIQLVKERNRLARSLGFADFADLAYAYFEIDCRKVFDYASGLLGTQIRMQDDYKSKMKSLTGSEDHWTGRIELENRLSVAFAELEPDKPLRMLMDSWGMNDIFDKARIVVGKTGELFTRCIPLSIPDDIIVFVDRLNALRDSDSIFHEFGHGLHFAVMENAGFIDADEPLMKEMPSVFFNYIDRGQDWINHYATDASAEDKEMLKLTRLVDNPEMIMGQCFDTVFEIECYKDENLSFDEIHRKLYLRLFGRETTGEANFQGIDFSMPFYQQSYLLGFGFSKLFYERILEIFGTILDERVGMLLTGTLLSPGNSKKFADRILSLADKLEIKEMQDWMSGVL